MMMIMMRMMVVLEIEIEIMYVGYSCKSMKKRNGPNFKRLCVSDCSESLLPASFI